MSFQIKLKFKSVVKETTVICKEMYPAIPINRIWMRFGQGGSAYPGKHLCSHSCFSGQFLSFTQISGNFLPLPGSTIFLCILTPLVTLALFIAYFSVWYRPTILPHSTEDKIGGTCAIFMLRYDLFFTSIVVRTVFLFDFSP